MSTPPLQVSVQECFYTFRSKDKTELSRKTSVCLQNRSKRVIFKGKTNSTHFFLNIALHVVKFSVSCWNHADLPFSTALKWYRANCNIQAEIEEMQEEQRSLSTLETLSVWRLVRDDTVRWQVLSVVVINIGMQLSSIDAVSQQRCSFTRFHCCVHLQMC